MTTTPIDYFDKTPGTLEQLVLAVVTQKLINRDYIHESLRTDFTSNAVNYGITLDTEDDIRGSANLALSLTFPTMPFERQLLIDSESYERKIMSINSLGTDTFSLPQKASYPIKSFPAQLPEYLSLDVPDNTLERRIMALCLHIRNYQNWVARWNYVANQWIVAKYADHFYDITSSFSRVPIEDLEIERDKLLLEFNTQLTFKPYPQFIGIAPVGAIIRGGIVIGNPSTAQQLEAEIAGTETSDPASDSQQSPMSENLMNELTSSGLDMFANAFGGAGGDPPAENPQETPTLPNC